MKNVYICEKCGASYSDYDECYACESGHVDILDDMAGGYEPELKDKLTWKAGCRWPEKVYIPCCTWDHKSNEYRTYIVGYKLAGELPEKEAVSIVDSHDKRIAEEERRWKEEWERRHKEEAAV